MRHVLTVTNARAEDAGGHAPAAGYSGNVRHDEETTLFKQTAALGGASCGTNQSEQLIIEN
jgi:hypothetical protein